MVVDTPGPGVNEQEIAFVTCLISLLFGLMKGSLGLPSHK